MGAFAATTVALKRLRLSGEIGSAITVAGSVAGPGGLVGVDSFTVSAGGVRQVRHAVVTGQWRTGGLELSARLIARSKMALETGQGWEAGAAVMPLPGLRLRLTGGRMPLASSLYLPFRHELSFGVELLPKVLRPGRGTGGGTVFEAEPDGNGHVGVVIRALASRVEIAGDFSGWEAVPLVNDGKVWRAVIAAPPGVHQVNVRFDGGPWQVPPGLGSTEDGFGGRTGVFVIR